MRNLILAAAVVALGVGGSTACASKKYVRTSVGEVNTKVETLVQHARGDPGADAQERGAHRRSRSEGDAAGQRPTRRGKAAAEAKRRRQRPVGHEGRCRSTRPPSG